MIRLKVKYVDMTDHQQHACNKCSNKRNCYLEPDRLWEINLTNMALSDFFKKKKNCGTHVLSDSSPFQHFFGLKSNSGKDRCHVDINELSLH